MRAHTVKVRMTSADVNTMAESQTKKREPNFSATDCLLLVEIMAEESGVGGLSFHSYMKHRFTPTITSATKKTKWVEIEQRFNLKAGNPRDCNALQKKWDNLVQCHRCLYADHMHSMNLTGGGPGSNRLSVLTEAVMGVVGCNSQSTVGVAGTLQMDSSLIQSSQHNESTSTTEMARGRPEESNSSYAGTSSRGAISIDSSSTSSKHANVQVVCCRCHCHRTIEALKEEKLRLQIRALKRKLGDPEE